MSGDNHNQADPLEPFSEAALERQRAVAEKEARGEKVGWTDLIGLLEPNPALPDCPRENIDTGYSCELPHHHDGPHRATIEW